MKQTKKIILIGAGGHAASISDAILSSQRVIKGYIDEKKSNEAVMGHKVYKSILEIDNYHNYEYCIAVGDNSLRERIFKKTIHQFKDVKFATIIHSSSYVSNQSILGDGTVILGNSFIGPRCHIKNHCIINSGTSIDHDCHLDEFSSTGPGSIIGGTVSVGKKSVIAIGSSIKHNITIGDNSIVGANSYLKDDIGNNAVYYGTPARFIRDRDSDEKYL